GSQRTAATPRGRTAPPPRSAEVIVECPPPGLPKNGQRLLWGQVVEGHPSLLPSPLAGRGSQTPPPPTHSPPAATDGHRSTGRSGGVQAAISRGSAGPVRPAMTPSETASGSPRGFWSTATTLSPQGKRRRRSSAVSNRWKRINPALSQR